VCDRWSVRRAPSWLLIGVPFPSSRTRAILRFAVTTKVRELRRKRPRRILRLEEGKTFWAGFVTAGIAFQTETIKTTTTATDWTATEQDTHRHCQNGNHHDKKGHQENGHDSTC